MDPLLGTALLGAGLLALAALLLRKPSTPTGVPTGAFGWPLVGETFQLLAQPRVFVDDRVSRYGAFFATHVFGSPTIYATTPDAAKYFLADAQRLMKPGYPPSVEAIQDPTRVMDGALHSRIRKTLQPSLGPDALHRPQFVAFTDSVARETLRSWEGRLVNTHDEMRKYTFSVILHILCSVEPGPESDEMRGHFYDVESGFVSMPIRLPFTNYSRGLQARDRIFEAMDKMMAQRRTNHNSRANDVLDALMESEVDGVRLTDAQIKGVLMFCLIAGHETSSSLLTWIVMHLANNPDLWTALQKEHDSIRQTKLSADEALTWSDMKQMQLTNRVIQEALRISSLVAYVPRIPLDDMSYKGVVLPKDWHVHVDLASIHLNPDIYPEPHKFDPSRFEATPKPNTFIPFGTGHRICPGNELAKVESLIFLHQLVSTYSWEIISGFKGIEHWPIPRPKGGLNISVKCRRGAYVN
uniref:Pimaradiene oxidase 2 n=1 Tax=Calohypnum plumiforme TaxID=98943 RepID=A0A6F8PFR4_9BRYO|nr:pimaradiene oxidase 2 [Calohypnum plumiforme]